jgi:hypothetical protein
MKSSHFIQLTALLGDLSHKIFVYESTQSFNSSVTCLFANSFQAFYLLEFESWLVPDSQVSNHTLGTLFEFQYQVNTSFRYWYSTRYQSYLPCLTLLL